VQGRKGKNVAICTFTSKAEVEREFRKCELLKLGPQVVSWMSDDVRSPKVGDISWNNKHPTQLLLINFLIILSNVQTY
ncbi:unnamed protein product, partial [Allacma fusca]